LIIDENVHLLYCNDFQKHFNEKNLIIKVLKSGENNKNRENLNKVHDFLFENNFERNDIIIGMGGGVITDFAGKICMNFYRLFGILIYARCESSSYTNYIISNCRCKYRV
jgi:3-dehydroquinate synthase